MDDLCYYASLIDVLLKGTERTHPKEFTKDICAGIRYALSTLEERERICLKQRVCIGMSYANLAEILGVCPNTVRRIEGSAFRKLRDPSRWNYIALGIAGCLNEVRAHSETKGFREGYWTGYQDGQEDLRAGADRREVAEKALALPIEYMGLSTRASNCLTVSGCKRIGDVARLSDDEIRRMRNLGKRSANEIARALQSHSVIHTAWDDFLL